MNNYETLLNQLLTINLHHKVKLGIEQCQKMHEELNSPATHYKTIHVAGTNGKGSVTTKIAAALQAKGLKTGLFTSPHISTFRERIKINGIMISKKDVEVNLKLLLCKYPSATFFEITTLLAFLYFYDQNVSFAVIETGLGGRLDATNIIFPEISIITSINFDHMHILGETIEKITQEKAGIIKKNIPILIGPNVPLEVIKPIAKNLNAPLYQVVGKFENYEDENNAIAKKALELLHIDPAFIEIGLKAKPPCRFEIIESFKPKIILDVAHNPDGIFRFFDRLNKTFPNKKIIGILGFSKNKDVYESFKIAKNYCDEIYCIQGKGDRCLPIEDFESLIKDLLDQSVYFNHSIKDVIHHILSYNEEYIIAICGSFFIMSEIRANLGIHEEKDFDDLNERF